MSHTSSSYVRSSRRLSFEFFPPRSEAQQRRLWRTLGCLETLAPEFISVTWGALGSQSEASLDLLGKLVADTRIPVAAHLTCAGQTRPQMLDLLDHIEALGIQHLVVLRGDAGAEGDTATGQGDLDRCDVVLEHASDLVALIAERNASSTHTFDMSVAAYPEIHPDATSAESDLHWLQQKLDSGASRAITQFFFDPATFLRWRDSAVSSGIDKPLIPGILPIHDIDKVLAFSNKCGATVPSDVAARFKQADATSRTAIAVEECLALCDVLSTEGVEDFHLYTLNQSSLAWTVGLELAGIDPMASLQKKASAA